MIESLEISSFQLQVGEAFALSAPGLDASLPLVLQRADPLGGSARPGSRQPFALHFLGPVDPLLPQRIYRIESETMEPIEIFLVPIGRDGAGTTYEAIFT